MSTSEDKQDQKPARSRSLFEEYVCDGLGYCCPYAFLRCHRQVPAISDRLGLAQRTIRWWKTRFKRKELECDKRVNCMLAELRRLGK